LASPALEPPSFARAASFAAFFAALRAAFAALRAAFSALRAALAAFFSASGSCGKKTRVGRDDELE